jgi:hypothetical protein
MATRRYYSANAVDNTVLSGITSSVTTVTLASTPVGFPSQFPYTIAIDYDTSAEEVVLVTNAVGSVLTITRGYNGTSAQAHNAGAVVRHVIVAQDMTDFQDHIAATGSVHGVSGALAAASDLAAATGAIASTNTALAGHTGAVSGVHGVTGNVVGDTDTQTLTNKTINYTANTITNLPDATPVVILFMGA